ncbi:MAG: hypothetical protein M0009_00935 [Deltaproteobacteria bacterium]|nr:hypothetical protein [Deltaproteobacteria bacterium]
MEQAIVAPQKAKMSAFTGRVPLRGALLAAVLCFLAISLAGAAESTKPFEQSGIHFPGGFDLNTVGELQGKIAAVYRPSGSGPVIVSLETEWETYAVVTCPPWYWDELKIKVSIGDEVRVMGSKSLGRDSNLYIIAQTVHLIQQVRTIALRSKTGTPLWDGPHGKADSPRGSGSRPGGGK